MPDPDQIPYVSTVKRLTNVDEIGDVPVIGGLYNAGNTVIDYLESDCHPDWHVYAETLFPALGQATLVLLSFGLDDVLRGYLRPGGGRGFGGLGRASRRGRRSTKATRAKGLLKKGIPEVGELLGKHLPGAQLIAARRTSAAERFLWRVDGLAQRGLWYWMIADILDDFTVNWTTGLYQSVDCRGIEVGGMERHAQNTSSPGIGFRALPLTEDVDEWGVVNSTTTTVSAPPGYQGALVYTVISNNGSGLWRPMVVDLGAVYREVRGGPSYLNPETGLYESSVVIRSANNPDYQWGIETDVFGTIDISSADATFLATGGPL